MKKEYIIPEVETIELQMNCQMLAGSLEKNDTELVTDEEEVLAPSFFLEKFGL